MKIACYQYKNKHIDQWKREGNPEKLLKPGNNPNVHQQLGDKLWYVHSYNGGLYSSENELNIPMYIITDTFHKHDVE